MDKSKRPIKRSIFIFTLAFITLLCLFLSILTYTTFTNTLYKSYNRRMTDILKFVESHIDKDNLYECVKTGEESEEYTELVAFMDSIMEDFDIHFLYIVTPIVNDEQTVIMNVISADTAEGRETDPDGYYLDLILDDVYEEADVIKYNNAYQKNEISFFKNFSDWGYDYTALLPLKNSNGERYAALCVDIEVEDLQNVIKTYTGMNVVLIAFLGVLFITFFILWMNKNITEPIRQLEKSVVSFAIRSHDQTDPEKLKYEAPVITTHNEVESLSDAVTQLSADMRQYVRSILDEKGKVETMKTEVSRMDMLAYQDALTHVKNKAWYDEVEKRVNEDIENGTARFGIIMADLNNLKKINDNYGHEHGNDYIFGACHLICVTFDHSPVFRIGGDEFVILLERSDYDNRERLLSELKIIFKTTSHDESKEPWERYSVATGMAEFNPGRDTCMNDVFKRADELMYANKVASKMARQ